MVVGEKVTLVAPCMCLKRWNGEVSDKRECFHGDCTINICYLDGSYFIQNRQTFARRAEEREVRRYDAW